LPNLAAFLTIYRRVIERMIGLSTINSVEEPVMHTRFVLFSAATLMNASAFAAEPVKLPVQPAVQPQTTPAQVMLASADDVRAPSPTDQQTQTAPKRPRIGRVTTCRCGDPQSQPEQ
jgi:hypothetical protein